MNEFTIPSPSAPSYASLVELVASLRAGSNELGQQVFELMQEAQKREADLIKSDKLLSRCYIALTQESTHDGLIADLANELGINEGELPSSD